MKKVLVIQTAFFGDAILATALLEHIHNMEPDTRLSILVRNGNQALFEAHPFVHEVIVWNKQEGKFSGLIQLIREVRKRKFDLVINLQRFFSTGMLTALSGATHTAGFDKNPWAFAFTRSVPHRIGDGMHEVNRNQQLIADRYPGAAPQPKLYPSAHDKARVAPFAEKKYVTMAPASVWFTKQLPASKWVELCDAMAGDVAVFLIGAKSDADLCASIAGQTVHTSVQNLAGKLKPLETAALMEHAAMNYVNDSGPLHLASAMNAPVTAFFCSTVPAFGFGPLSDRSVLAETREKLACRPCGLHGRKSCPEGHFRCATTIAVTDFAGS